MMPSRQTVASHGCLCRGNLGGRRGRRHCRPALPVCWLLLILFVGLQIADIITTNHALTIPGIWEANPLVALFARETRRRVMAAKLAVVGYLCVAASFWSRRWPMIFAVSVSGAAVLGNLTHL